MMWEKVAVVVVVAAISVATVTAIVALRGFVEKAESLVVAVVPFVKGFVAITALRIVATESAVAVSVRDNLAGLSVAEIANLVVQRSMGMYSY